VAFIGVFSGGTGIFTQKALLVQTDDTIGGQTLTSFGYPVINDSGVVAFVATYPGGEGIFTQSSLIVKTGDTIGGKTLIGLGQPAINISGAVAFAASFSDHSSAVIVARPAMVSAEYRSTHEAGIDYDAQTERGRRHGSKSLPESLSIPEQFQGKGAS
jgi:hypothetical protein